MDALIPAAALVLAGAGAAVGAERLARREVTMPVDQARRSVLATLAISVFLGVNVLKALRTRHPWTLTCHGCRVCAGVCPKGLDPSRFVAAARVNDPELPSRVEGRREVPVRDAVRLCVGCGLCERSCPLELPITRVIDDLKDDGGFD
jgi:ferredoxin